MWRTWLTRLAQAAGVVQAGVGQTGRRGAGGRAAGGVCGTSCGLRRMMKKVARGPWSKQVLTRGAIYMIIGAK